MDRDTFLRIVAAAPLVSVDLILRNNQGQVLLGLRQNRPAQGFWFVPGGRIRKNERIAEATQRISETELGIPLRRGRLLGAFDHIYEDNFHGQPGINTHYVVLAFEFRLATGTTLTPDSQHADLKWWDVTELLASAQVHANTKRYFSAPSK